MAAAATVLIPFSWGRFIEKMALANDSDMCEQLKLFKVKVCSGKCNYFVQRRHK